MTDRIRSRRAGGLSPEQARNRPLYARALGLQYVRPSNLMCFLFFEGTIALAVLLSLAELTGWWAVAVLPASVAAMVKINDVIAGATTRTGEASVTRARAATRRALNQPTVRLREATPQPPYRSDHAPYADSAVQPGADVRPGFGDLPGDDLPGYGVAGHGGPGYGDAEQARPVSPAAEEPWIGSAEQRARQSAAYRYE